MTDVHLGTTVSHYRILSHLGDGGMGVVYEAEDLTLGRKAALKFLPEKNTADPAMLERFLREARSASALNHPGICTVYEFGEHEEKPFLAMELLEGQSLDKLKPGAGQASLLTFGKLLDLAIQVADALDAAHRKDIVHRDIKPANIFLTKSGQAKVLDFGLAKLIAYQADREGDRDRTSDATSMDTAILTNPGAALGTIAYMSPEQARGEELDTRTDLFSFGVVLYQLSTGKHPFPGATTAIVFDQLLNRAPLAPMELNPALPAAFENILNKLLDKDRDTRYQSAGDLRADLKRLRKETTSDHALLPASQGGAHTTGGFTRTATSGTGSSGTGALSSASSVSAVSAVSSAAQPLATSSVGQAVPKKSGGKWAIAALVLLLIAGAAWAAWRFYPRTAPFAVINLHQITQSGNVSHVAMSPDGRTLAEVKNDGGLNSLWIRNIPTNTDTQVLPGFPSQYIGLAFTPDGNNLYFVRGSETSRYIRSMYVISVLGGTPRLIIRDVDSGASFSPDGSKLVYKRQTPEVKDHAVEMHVADKDGGNDHEIYRTANRAGDPAWSPDGTRIAWPERTSSLLAPMVVYDLATQKARELPEPKGVQFDGVGASGGGVAWLPDGKHMLATFLPAQSDRTQIGSIDADTGAFSRVTNDTNGYVGLALSSDGRTLATVLENVESNISYYKQDGGAALSTMPLRVSPSTIAWLGEDKLVLTSLLNAVNVLDKATGKLTQVDMGTTQPGSSGSVCPDGSFVLSAIPAGVSHSQLLRLNLESGAMTTLVATADVVRTPVCLSDGKAVDYSTRDAKGSFYPWQVPLDGGAPRRLINDPSLGSVLFSRDGARLAMQEAAAASNDQFLAAVYDTATGKKTVVPLDPHYATGATGFSPDGSSLVYEQQLSGQMALAQQPIGGGAPRTIIASDPAEILSFGWSPSGKQLALLRLKITSDVVLIDDLNAQKK